MELNRVISLLQSLELTANEYNPTDAIQLIAIHKEYRLIAQVLNERGKIDPDIYNDIMYKDIRSNIETIANTSSSESEFKSSYLEVREILEYDLRSIGQYLSN